MKSIYEKFCIWIVKKFGSQYYTSLVNQNALLIKDLNAANVKIAELSKS